MESKDATRCDMPQLLLGEEDHGTGAARLRAACTLPVTALLPTAPPRAPPHSWPSWGESSSTRPATALRSLAPQSALSASSRCLGPAALQSGQATARESAVCKSPPLLAIPAPRPTMEETQPQVEQMQVEQPQVEQPQVEQPQMEQPQVEQPQVEQPQVEQPQVEQPQVEQPQVEQPQVEQMLEELDLSDGHDLSLWANDPPPTPTPAMLRAAARASRRLSEAQFESRCWACRKTGSSGGLAACQVCRVAHYCSEACQEADAERHEEKCAACVEGKSAEKLASIKAKLMAGRGSPEQRLVWAGGLGSESALQSVLAEGMSVDGVVVMDDEMIAGKPAIIAAAEWGHAEALRILLDRKANVNALDGAGNSALMLAARWGFAEAVEQLLLAASASASASASAASLEIADKDGRTALLASACNKQPKALDLLIKAGGKVNHADKNGSSALHLAVWLCNMECIELLLAASADLEIADKDGRTAVLVAAYNNQPKALELLIKAGAK